MVLTSFTRSAWALALCASISSAQVCPVAFDINTLGAPNSSGVDGATTGTTKVDTRSFVSLGGSWFFSASTASGGTELYKTGGNPASTVLVKDINPNGDSNPGNLRLVGSHIYFTADDGVHGEELWRTDGTGAGTVLVKDVLVGGLGGQLSGLTALGNKLIFLSYGDNTGSSIWVSDGSTAGTTLLIDISLGLSVSEPGGMAVDASGSLVLFRADDGLKGAELWRTDGTPAGTQLVKDINNGALGSQPTHLVTWNGKTYFEANDGGAGTELWSTDGTGIGTNLVADIRPGAGSSSLSLKDWAEFNGELYFRANNGSAGVELFKTDGTSAGTVLVADIRAGAGSSIPGDMTEMGGALFFQAHDGGSSGRELRKLSAGGVVSLVKDIAPGTAGGLVQGDNHLIALGGVLCFVAKTSATGRELWKSDGTTAGTALVIDLELGSGGSDPTWLTSFFGSFLFFSAETSGSGRELWISDLSAAGTQLIKDINPGTHTQNSDPDQVRSMNGASVYFSADNGVNGDELWKWDANGGASMVKDINPGSASSSPADFISVWSGGQEVIFFRAVTAAAGEELWRTDGTAAGTNMVADIMPGTSGSFPWRLYEFDGQLFFSASDGVSDNEPWVSDGTAAGTFLLYDINITPLPFPPPFPQTTHSSPSSFTALAGQLFFSAFSGFGVDGFEIWVTDGTTAGTHQFMDLYPGSPGSDADDFTLYNGRLYFGASQGPGMGGRELWSTDGTVAGTQLVADLIPGLFGSSPIDLEVAGDLLFFRGQVSNLTFERELFVSDGTVAGSLQLTNLVGAPLAGVGQDFAVSKGILYFNASDGAAGFELWRSDGTVAGTFMLKDIWPGAQSSLPDSNWAKPNLIATSEGVYFAATNGSDGRELWYSDGTASGTQMVCDTFAGPGDSNPCDLTLAGGELIFQAESAAFGTELHRLPVTGPYAISLGFHVSSHLAATSPKLGSTMTITCDGIPAGSVSLLVMSTPVAKPTGFLTAPGSASWIDPGTATLVSYFVLVSDWTLNQTLPLTPSLAGVQINMQAYHLAGAAFPAVTSNGLSVVIGS